jgi:hypothetical protein
MTDATDFSAPELAAINAMMRASKTLPDDMWAVAAVQNLACLYAKIEPPARGRQGHADRDRRLCRAPGQS